MGIALRFCIDSIAAKVPPFKVVLLSSGLNLGLKLNEYYTLSKVQRISS